MGRYVEVLTLDHYLEVLKTKPGGLLGATALAQAKSRGAFSASHQTYWDAAHRAREAVFGGGKVHWSATTDPYPPSPITTNY